MPRVFGAERLGPIVAGLGGLLWFWAELAPQRAGFADTDDPAVSLQFLAMQPGAWLQGGLALAVGAIGLIATVLTTRDRLAGRVAAASPDLSARAVGSVGMIAAAFLLGMAAVRLSGGPVLYVHGLRQEWGETAYLITQFVGIQLFGAMGLALLALWILGVALLGARRGAIPVALAALAVLPGLRVLAIPAFAGLVPGELWFVGLLAIPAAFAWLLLLGLWPAPRRTAAAAARAPAPL